MHRSYKQIMTPGAFQGTHANAPYFEGWYYKLADASSNTRLAVIPGMMLDPHPENNQAFVQVMDGETTSVVFKQYPLHAFHARKNVLDIQVGANHFTDKNISLNLETETLRIKGEVRFQGITPWPVTLFSPGIMGWYAWVPFMECYHGVVSLDHALLGSLEINGKQVSFDGGRGYIEKDWGRSFPESWIWMQTNHFSLPGTSLSASIARIPWMRSAFPGFIVGFWHAGVLHRFATYLGSRVERLELNCSEINWTLVNHTHRLEITADRAHAGLLHAPGDAGMGRRVAESLSADFQVRLSHKNGAEIFADLGKWAGLEVVGDVSRLNEVVR